MGRIKDTFKNLGKQLNGFPKNKQGKAFARILQFFALMVALTIFAKGAAGATMPVVKVVGLTQQNIRNASDYTGTVTAANKEDVKLPEGLTVAKVHVSPGTTVKTGDELVTFEMDKLKEKQTDQCIALQEMKIKLNELQQKASQDDSAVSSAQKARDGAQTSLNSARAEGDRSIAGAQATIDEANAVLASLQTERQSLIDFINLPPQSVPPVESGIPASGTSMTKDEAKVKLAEIERLITEQNGVIGNANRALETAKSDAAKSVESAQKALDEANKALSEAQAKFNEATPGFNLEQQKRKLDITKQQQLIADQQELIAKVQVMLDSGGVAKATIDGTITTVTVTQSAVTTATDYVRISTGAEGYLVEFSVAQDKAKEIKMGSLVSVKQGNYYWGSEARVVGRSMPDETGQVKMRAQLTSNEWSDGDSVTVSVVLSDKQYWTCVPVAALRPDKEGFYVLIVMEEKTILGTQTVARKVTVTVTDKDNDYAAVEGIYENNPRIIVSGSKPVNDGDMVRLDEASTK